MTINKKKFNVKNRSWRFWLAKRLLNQHINNKEIYTFVRDLFKKNNEDMTVNESSLSENDENDLINNILKLDDKSVQDIMVPRAEIISISIQNSMQDIFETINRETHSRMPIHNNNLDNALGMIHIKDILNNINKKDFEIRTIIRDILYVAPSSPVLDLLARMRKSKIHLGLVVDEHGGVDGLITIEDLVEEIVGEIEDEHDAEDYEVNIRKISQQTFIVDASTKLDDLERLLDMNFENKEKDQIDTIGGLVFYIAGKIPLIGEVFNYNNLFTFEIVDASERRIHQIKIINKK